MRLNVLRKFALILFLVLGTTSSFAQKISYNHKTLLKEGCTNVFTVVKQQDKFYVVITVNSYFLSFLNPPTLKIKDSTGKVYEFSGSIIGEDNITLGSAYNGTGYVGTYNISKAQFEVTPEQFEILKGGIKKLRLSTVPYVHEKEFKKDKLGKKLYKAYEKLLNDDF